MTDFMDSIHHPPPRLPLVGMPAHPVGLSEIAQRLGVSTRTVERYADRQDLDFPEPVVVGGRRIWEWAQVERWARKTLPLPRPGRPPKTR